MTNDKGIFIKNIYYMLSYAFQSLKINDFTDMDFENFDSIHELFAVILEKGTAKQVKQGLYREYIIYNGSLPILRGKIDMDGAMMQKIHKKIQFICEYEELSENNIYNQIIKCTINFLMKADDVKTETKHRFKKILAFFYSVDLIMPDRILWSRLNFQRNNKNYEILLNICYLILNGMIQTTEKGSHKMIDITDEHIEKLYEKFILEYYRKHYPGLNASAKYINWNLTEKPDSNMIKFLPNMKTDITLSYGNKKLIIDAKYYEKSMLVHYDKETLRSTHLYQIFAYVKNSDTENKGDVSGLILYAKTSENTIPDYEFEISRNKISAKTLDLNTDFENISNQLDEIVKKYFNITKI